MIVNHVPKTEEVFDKAYVDVETCRSVQVWPVPEDLENWYEIDFDPTFKYMGKIYDPSTSAWGVVVPTIEMHNAKMIKARQKGYAQTDKLFMEWQFDQTDEAKNNWIEAVARVKTDSPFK
ncbi:MAG: hypothetical protein ACI9W0_001255 [Gammaproteobacteria bacterium]|jgi:hypothetical protein